MSSADIMQLIQSIIWLLAGVGVFIVGMNFMGEALEKSAGSGMKKMLERISNNRISGLGIGAGVTAIIQSSSATSVMVIGLVNAGVMTLMQATPILLGAKIGTTVTGLLVALKNDYFNMAMYILAFSGVMMGFSKKEKVKLAGLLCSGLGLIFVGLNVMSSEDAFRNPLVMDMFKHASSSVDLPILLVIIGVIFTALIQSSSAATGVIITMVGTGVLPLGQALFLVIGANVGTCVTALLAAVGGNTNAKRVALIHLTFNAVGAVLFTALVWVFKDEAVAFLHSVFPSDTDTMSLQMRVSLFHVIFNVVNSLLFLPIVEHLVNFSRRVIKDKNVEDNTLSLKYVDDRLLATPQIALMQVKKEMDYMVSLVEENITNAFVAMDTGSDENGERIFANEEIIDFTNGALTKFLIKLSAYVEKSDEKVIGSYFHVLNDLERIGDHAENFHEIGLEMIKRNIAFSDHARVDIDNMRGTVMRMFELSKDAFENIHRDNLPELATLEEAVDAKKKELIAGHFARLAEGNCSVDVSPYYSSVIGGLERVADHLMNVGYSIINPTGSANENH